MKNLVKIGVLSIGLFGLVACAQEQTAVCTIDNGDGTENTMEIKAKDDEITEMKHVFITNYETGGTSKEEATIMGEESIKEYQGVQGVEYTYTADETAISENIIVNYAEENWPSLKSAGFEVPSKDIYFSLEKAVENYEASNYVCEIQ